MVGVNYNHVRSGWRDVDGRRIYFRSHLEYNCSLVLQSAKDRALIKNWEYEPYTFWFETIKRGVRSYKPDFRVDLEDGAHFWIEAKGYMDAKSKTKLKRFRKYYPEEKIFVATKVTEVSNVVATTSH